MRYCVGFVCSFVALVGFAAWGQETGLQLRDPNAYQGFTLFCPSGHSIYLIDMNGRVVHKWDSAYSGANSGYLLENGNLLRGGEPAEEHPIFQTGGAAGRIQMLSWDGDILWDFDSSSETTLTHHDIAPMPNGNVLMLRYELMTEEEAVAAGRVSEHAGDLWIDSIIEVKQTGETTGEIVWEWHLWDHLIQDADPDKPNYGSLADHPELANINPIDWLGELSDEERESLEAVGYLGGGDDDDEEEDDHNPDWNHTNAIDYNADLDQIAISVIGFNELLVIDHSTTTEEAASHSGGKHGIGGDILYRWGNPRSYRHGEEDDRQLFSQHNVQWIAEGLPGAGNILIFNNGRNRPGDEHSSVDEIITPINPDGGYDRESGKAFGPEAPTWTYKSPNPEDFYSSYISGAHRLPNGNTFICSGANGTFFEVTQNGDIVWKYINPIVEDDDEEEDDDGDDDGDRGKKSRPVFRATRYGLDYPAFRGRTLTPGKALEGSEAKEPTTQSSTL